MRGWTCAQRASSTSQASGRLRWVEVEGVRGRRFRRRDLDALIGSGAERSGSGLPPVLVDVLPTPAHEGLDR